MPRELTADDARKTVEPGRFGCTTTEETKPLSTIIGQERAVRALGFGLENKEKGFNIYVAGAPGTGRTTAVKSFVEEIAIRETIPCDWCYVNNFKNDFRPRALDIPSGKGEELKSDLEKLVSEARTSIPKTFESREYSDAIENISKEFEQKRAAILERLGEKAKARGFLVRITPTGPAFIPLVGNQPITNEQFQALSEKEQQQMLEKRGQLESEMRETLRDLVDLERQLRDEATKANKQVVLYAIGHLTTDLKKKYKEFAEVVTYVGEVEKDMIDNYEQFIEKPQDQRGQQITPPWVKELPFRKYEVNVVADNSKTKGAPVVIELNPTYTNLFGRMEKEALFGALTTDFTMIVPGSIHRANGGYLVMPAEELLRNPLSYESLKRAMKNARITMEEPMERLGYLTAKTLSPEPIPFNMKVIIIGSSNVYQLLYSYDPDFTELFKVKAEFDITMKRTEENMVNYAAFVCALCKNENLKHLDSSALAKLLEHSSRLAEDNEKLSTEFAQIADIIREANFYATKDNSKYVKSIHVKSAIEERFFRSNLIEEKIKEYIAANIFLIETQGNQVGQVNGLSVISLGDTSFGRPSRVTATVGLGREGLVDIEREVKLGGPIHTKGVLILGGYLSRMYAQDKPLSVSARLVFEQSYEGVEGDSASSTELYALLSALSGLPIRQDLAVTGSVNQMGEVQAIGGINEKIEGFFEICKLKGLSGTNGVMMPESNTRHLMLKEEVVQAIREKEFHIYPVKTIDEGIEVLTGVKAGTSAFGKGFEPGSVNDRVNTRLRTMAETLSSFGEESEKSKKSRDD
ncbi:MAG: AAA family ATPase [archaeon]